MSKNLRVGFIGSGWAERVQIPAFKIGGLHAQAIASGRVENAERAASQHAIPEVYADWRDLVASEAVDIVSITTPPNLHAEIAVTALQAGKHVICEKPTALNAAEAEKMLAAAQAAPNQLAIVDHELRFTPQRQAIRRLFRQHYVGRGLWVELTWRYPARLDPAQPWNWWSDVEQGGGALGAIGSHLLDLSRWLFGHIEMLSAQLKTGLVYRNDPGTGDERLVTADDHAHIALRFTNGMDGAITASAISPGAPGMTVTLYGTEGALRLDEADRLWGMKAAAFAAGEWTEIDVDDPVKANSELPAGTSFARGSVYLAQAIARTLGSGEHWIADAASFYDGLKAQQMIDAARRSHAEQAWVRF
ncbi:MAG: Gfo/Idh/MocA family oxidoreductase [Caldilineaceae bacterium]|nr:Gfo/Idh/MocA family oxidoreductase [Caldilineaceae bacterium]